MPAISWQAYHFFSRGEVLQEWSAGLQAARAGLDHGEPRLDEHVRLDRAAAHLTVALGGVAVAAAEQGAADEHRQQDLAALHQVLRVDVAAVLCRVQQSSD